MENSNSLGDYDESARSENGQYVLAWSDSTSDGSIGGARDKGNGRYALFSGDRLILKGSLQRPNDGNVSDQGIFALNDWMFGGGPQGTFYVFDTQGKVLISHKYKANLGINGISSDGRYAVSQAYYADSEDGNNLSFFDLSKRILVWKFEPIPGPPEGFRFDTESSILYLIYKNNQEYRYDFKGNFLDADNYENYCIESALEAKNAKLSNIKGNIESSNGYELMDLAGSILNELWSGNPDPSAYDEPILLLNKALERGISEYNQALVNRQLGELHLERGEHDKAISHFERALVLNPKIGLKKQLAKLKTEA
jgi:tetratricopeptide (TPR) repeat protein